MLIATNKENPAVLKAHGELLGLLNRDLIRRSPGGAQLIMTLTGEPKLYRAKDPTDEVSTATPEAVIAPTGRYQLVADVRQILQGHVGRLSVLQELSDWGRATLLRVVPDAAEYADRLLIQLGCPGSHLSVTASHCRELAFQVCSRLQEYQELAQRCAKRLIDEVLRAAGGVHGNQTAALLRLVTRSGRVRLEWLDDRGTCLRREGLQRWSKGTLIQPLRELVVQARELSSLKRRCEELATETDALQHARLASALRLACLHRRPVSLRLAAASARKGIPLSVWMEIDPRGVLYNGSGACILSVSRAHDEFVLEGPPPEHHLFYFPPCTLVARVIFAGRGVSVSTPRVRQFKGGYEWVHPYTGPLAAQAADCIMMDDDEPAAYRASPPAVAMFPGLACGVPDTMEADLCITDQSHLLRKITQRFARGALVAESADVLGLVSELHDLTKLGLTRAHQLNTQTPRSALAPSSMKYVVTRLGTGGRFENRIFPYHPRSTRQA